jgi:hypothetical protein
MSGRTYRRPGPKCHPRDGKLKTRQTQLSNREYACVLRVAARTGQSASAVIRAFAQAGGMGGANK